MDSIKQHLEDFFKQLHFEDVRTRPNFAKLNLKSISEEQSELSRVLLLKVKLRRHLMIWWLTKPRVQMVSRHGSIRSVCTLCVMIFLKVFNEFHHCGFLEWRLNTRFLSLIPKDNGDKSVNGLRPIALLFGVYKILAKVLANRLKPLFGSLIYHTQGVNIEGRQIQDISMVANELLDTRRAQKVGGLIYKLDFYKAFDRVSWGFLDLLMEKYGFNPKCRRWLLTCWWTASFSILLNGSIGSTFKGSRGLRQGDPLSPLIFVLAMEVLSQLLAQAQSAGVISGFEVKSGGTRIPLLQFANCSLVFTNGTLGEAMSVKQ